MKKILYFVLLFAELIAGYILMSLAWNNIGAVPCIITIAVTAALLIWQGVTVKKSKGKAKRNIALILLIPIVAAIGMAIWLIIGLASVI